MITHKNPFSKSSFLPLVAGIVALTLAQQAFANHVVVLEHAIESKVARMAKLLKAEKTIDALYFAVEEDEISVAGLALLRNAALNKVRVRVIIDSMHNKVSRAMMAALMYNLPPSAQGRIEIREFNPFNIFHPLCYSRRMHDKTLIIDGKTLIVGDRNVANGYFDMPSADSHGRPLPLYQGLDVMVEGGLSIQQAQQYFQDRWSSRDVKPVALYEFSPDEMDPASCMYKNADSFVCEQHQEQNRKKIMNATKMMDQAIARMNEPDYQQLLQEAEQSWLIQGFTSRQVEFIHDSVLDKKLCKGKSEDNIASHLYQAILENTQDKLLIVTPYLTITPKMENLIRDLKAKNPNIMIRFLTNAVESNDVPAAHAGYQATRQKLIDAGVQIYEFRRFDRSHDILETLHAKVVLMDNKKVFIGSYNWDYRSEQVNSEVGALIELTGDENLLATQDIRDRLAEMIRSSTGLDTNHGGIGGTGGELQPNITAEEVDRVAQLVQRRRQSARFWGKLLKLPVLGEFIMQQL
jgi:putative cardiolipin synthase